MTPAPWGRHLAAVAACMLAILVWQYLAIYAADQILGIPNDAMPGTFWAHWQAYPWTDRVYRTVQAVTGFLAAIAVVHLLFSLYQEQVALHGTARFATLQEMKKGGLFAAKGILLARHNSRYLVYDGQEFVLLAAPTRSGKGVGLVIPNLLNWRDSVVVLDVKLENWLMTSGWRQKVLKQDVFLFNPFAPQGQTNRWNPLDAVSRDPAQMPVDILQIAQVLYPSNAGDKNRFFYDTAQNLFMALAMFLIESRHPSPSLSEVFRQASGNGKPLDEHLDDLLENHQGLSPACRDAFSRFLSTAGETRANVKATFDAALLIFAAPTVEWATSASDFSLADIRRQPMSIYFGVPVDKLELASRLINLFFTQAIHLNTRVLPEDDPDLRHQALLCLDEFPAFGRLQVVLKGVAFIAGYNLRLLTIVQSTSQLKSPEMYGTQGAETLIANHAVRVIFPPTTQSEAKEYAEMLGTYTLRETSQSHSVNAGHALSIQSSSNVGTNTSSQRRSLLLPQELKQLPRNTAIIDKQGMHPARCTKAYYYEDRVFIDRLAQVSNGLETILQTKRLPTQDDVTRLRVAGEFAAQIGRRSQGTAPSPNALMATPSTASATGSIEAHGVAPPTAALSHGPGRPVLDIESAAARLAQRLPSVEDATSVGAWINQVIEMLRRQRGPEDPSRTDA